jgi:hypothetical protein
MSKTIPVKELSPRMRDITGTVVGSLTATKPLYKRNKNSGITWEWKCVCGNTCEGELSTLLNNARISNNPNIPSCGCKKIEVNIQVHTTHGKTKHPIYLAYAAMLDRCYNPNCKTYAWYGAKGVKVCDEWKDSPSTFIEWALANGWAKGLVLDKDELSKKLNINPPSYSPMTCQWITKKENLKLSSSRENYLTNKHIKIPKEAIPTIKSMHNSGIPVIEIAKQFNVHISTIYPLLKESCNG